MGRTINVRVIEAGRRPGTSGVCVRDRIGSGGDYLDEFCKERNPGIHGSAFAVPRVLSYPVMVRTSSDDLNAEPVIAWIRPVWENRVIPPLSGTSRRRS